MPSKNLEISVQQPNDESTIKSEAWVKVQGQGVESPTNTMRYLGNMLCVSWGYFRDILRISGGNLGGNMGDIWGFILGVSWV